MCAQHSCEETTPQDHDAIEHLLDLSFGSDRHSKTSYRLREGNAPVPGLSLVVRDPGVGVAGTISFWPLAIGPKQSPALLLGPLAVHPDRQGLGIGLGLMREGLTGAARCFPGRDVRIAAQQRLERFYADLGFVTASAPYLEDGIPHVDMLRGA